MLKPLRRMLLATCALLGVVMLLNGCGSETAGETLTVEIVPNRAYGVLQASSSNATSTTTDTYTADVSLSAVVTYRGTKELAFQWSHYFEATGTGAQPTANGSSAPQFTSTFTLSVPHGTSISGRTWNGTVTLTVYEPTPGKDAQQKKTVSVPLIISAGSSG